ncbi:chaperone modulator CbpM [Bradyrhizobium lablabi]|uniref:chaperone modulator CbpM n=1 Tax=Bradyrhizobium lablabi TaxID=722472 RepID=UPI001BAABC84|nr:chaperone modulator CbpM [Bradyrhizobium lablabi]MBR0693950.1 MerR family transcriptional regulator [Bradyrhizobium lablabi]
MTKQEFLASAGLEVQTLEFWIEQQWLIPEQTATETNFSDKDVARAHLIQDLKGGLGVNDEGVDVILHLIDQLHGLRHAFAQLHKEIQVAAPTRE